MPTVNYCAKKQTEVKNVVLVAHPSAHSEKGVSCITAVFHLLNITVVFIALGLEGF